MTTKKRKRTAEDITVLTPELAKKLEKGKIYRLGYNCYNIGIFYWEHDSIFEDIKSPTMFSEFRLKGRFSYESPEKLSDKGDYIYEFEGVMCRGSGAEPCYLIADHIVEQDLPHWDEINE